ncbi:unnamed protein product, partial [Phaeothamnion confervicola]
GRLGAFTVLFVCYSALVVCMTAVGVSNAFERMFLAAAATLSSTAVVTEFLGRSGLTDSVFARMVIDLVGVQDLVMCPLLAVPTAIMHVLHDFGGFQTVVRLALYSLIVACSALAARRLLPAAMRVLSHKETEPISQSLFLLGVVAYCLAFSLMCESLKLSHEAGALFAGLLMFDSPYASRAADSVEPLTDFFGGIYLASLGMIVNPAYLANNLGRIAVCVVVVATLKFAIVVGVMRSFGFSLAAAVMAGGCMAQVSEISLFFVARAQQMRLLSRHLYLMMVATTVVLLCVSPVIVAAVRRLNMKHFESGPATLSRGNSDESLQRRARHASHGGGGGGAGMEDGGGGAPPKSPGAG